MSDIVGSLREAFQRWRYGNKDVPDIGYQPDFDLFDAAADEIEQLRTKLKRYGRHTSDLCTQRDCWCGWREGR